MNQLHVFMKDWDTYTAVGRLEMPPTVDLKPTLLLICSFCNAYNSFIFLPIVNRRTR